MDQNQPENYKLTGNKATEELIFNSHLTQAYLLTVLENQAEIMIHLGLKSGTKEEVLSKLKEVSQIAGNDSYTEFLESTATK